MANFIWRQRKFLNWPLPALFAWCTSWLLFQGLRELGAAEWIAFLVATLWGSLLSKLAHTSMRKALVFLGFPLSMGLASGTFSLPPLGWLLLLGPVLLVYPRSAWRDAPFFPTPKKALQDLPRHVPLQKDARILDAGSGLGDGLIALRKAYPNVALHGLEMSWPLRLLSALRCRWARIEQGDIWLADWSGYHMVYLFQRPESMPRAVEKAQADLRPGCWLVSLEFEAAELQPYAFISNPGERPVWIYQAPFQRRS